MQVGDLEVVSVAGRPHGAERERDGDDGWDEAGDLAVFHHPVDDDCEDDWEYVS